jgi:crotonobetainyl-CoA:carnitine CoA-transferase CaiB-like acyl-CoA transferase
VGGRVMQGVRVIEVAQFVFAPGAAALLADWGADVIKIEHPVRADGLRGHRRWDEAAFDPDHNPLIEGPNRGKRSVGLDLESPAGLEVFYALVRTADVVITNFLPMARQRLKIDVEHLRVINPRLIYARASAYGDKGEERERGGFDGTVFWSHGGIADTLTPAELEAPLEMAVGGMGDMISAMNLAGGIGSALFHRERTGEALEVDVSLMSTAWWMAGAAINAALVSGRAPKAKLPKSGRTSSNPFIGHFKTADGGVISLYILQPGPHIRDTFEHLGLGELADDLRFSTATALLAHADEASDLLVAAFAARPLAEWRARLQTMTGSWAIPRTLLDVAADPQAIANDMLVEVESGRGDPLRLVRGPVQFDRAPVTTKRAPNAWEHTEEVLLELGFDWNRIEGLKSAGAVA